MPGLDEFYKYIEKKEQSGQPSEEAVKTAAPSKRSASGVGRVRYVLRGGMTVAEPVVGDDPEGEDGLPLEGMNGAAAHNGTNGVHAVEVEPTGSEEALAMWRRLPRHIQLLASISEPEDVEEVAQKYYTRDFKETRQQLIQRLLNPTLTLEETARVLGVCPATVRRYTNRGVLPHHRTVGQQRRFRLSDVLVFLQRQEQLASSSKRSSRRAEARREAEAADTNHSVAA